MKTFKNKTLFYICSVFFIVSSCSDEINLKQVTKNTNLSRPSIPISVDQVQIGNQIWKTKNLNVTKYRNGDVIPEIKNRFAFAQATTGAWCYYDNDPANGNIYGKLYNFYAVTDPRGLAPLGWHIPSISEWTTLRESVGYNATSIRATTLWYLQNGAISTNSTGFSSLPGGGRFEFDGDFNLTTECYFWTSTNSSIYPQNALSIIIYGSQNGIYEDDFEKWSGQSVRCIKN